MGRSVEKMLNDFASTKEVKGGDNRAYKTGDPEDAYNRWQNSINAKTGEGSASRLERLQPKAKAVGGDFCRRKLLQIHRCLRRTRFERFHEEMPHSANSQPPPAMHWALLINGL